MACDTDRPAETDEGLDVLFDPIERWGFKWTKADLTSAEKYITQEDLDLHHHFKSLHGTSCPQQILSCSMAALPEEYPRELLETKTGWRPIREDWSEVNDYHLLLPRVPDFFPGPGATTVVFGANAVKWKGGIEDMEDFVLEKVKALGLKKPYPTLPITKTKDEDRGKARSQGIIPLPIDYEEWRDDSEGSWELL